MPVSAQLAASWQTSTRPGRRSQTKGSLRGRIRVSSAISHGCICIVPVLGELMRRYPNILVDINLGDGIVEVGAWQFAAVRWRSSRAASARTAAPTSPRPTICRAGGVPETPEDRSAEPVWPFRRDGVDYALKVRGAIEAKSGDTLSQLVLDASALPASAISTSAVRSPRDDWSRCSSRSIAATVLT
ncbi:hypothetical protein [Bradyrhizobium sp. SZCCHNRI20481]|uniref:hypothetical protein n=1 Tax=Bradyrhizobium sp. SZCCHNRI20481 TaxID=3057286 RepID=UPI0029161019|nr:hypothetical protein [Bradyrhizobium sp. SZCCHNRI20481]